MNSPGAEGEDGVNGATSTGFVEVEDFTFAGEVLYRPGIAS